MGRTYRFDGESDKKSKKDKYLENRRKRNKRSVHENDNEYEFKIKNNKDEFNNDR